MVPDSVIPAALVDVLVGPGGGVPGAPGAGLQPAANARGVLARRSGVTPEQVAGTGWDIALGVSRICFVDRFQLFLHFMYKSCCTFPVGRLEVHFRSG